MQLEMGISTRRYLPARGTAGLDRSRVSGNKRVPCPPPMMIESTLLVSTDMRLDENIRLGNWRESFLCITLALANGKRILGLSCHFSSTQLDGLRVVSNRSRKGCWVSLSFS